MSFTLRISKEQLFSDGARAVTGHSLIPDDKYVTRYNAPYDISLSGKQFINISSSESSSLLKLSPLAIDYATNELYMPRLSGSPGYLYINNDGRVVSTSSFLLEDLNLKEDKINKGVAGGYASLDEQGIVPLEQLPQFSSTTHIDGGFSACEYLDLQIFDGGGAV